MKINTTKASTEMNILISSSPPKDVTAKIQKVINGCSPEDKLIILGVNRLGTIALKLHFRTKEDAAKSKSLNVDWGQAYEGLEAHKPQYGIVVHGVPTEVIDTRTPIEETVQQWEEDNAQ